MDVWLSQSHWLAEKAVLPSVQCSATQLQYKSTNLIHMGLFLDSILFHWTICLSLCQYLLIYHVEVCSFHTHFIESFQSWINAIFCQMLFLHVLSCSHYFYPDLFTWCTVQIDLWVLNHPCLPGINPTWSQYMML